MIEQGDLIRYGEIKQIQPCSYDFRVGTIFRDGQVINSTHAKARDQFLIQPGEIVSILTLEELKLPADIAGSAFAMNDQSSNGLLVLNPGHVDPGYDGPLTVKALNIRRVPMAISREMNIFTVVFERLSDAADPPYGKTKQRADRERDFNARDVEIAPKSLSELIVLSKDAPFPNRQEVREMIANHWMSYLSIGLSVVAAIASIIAAYFAARPNQPIELNKPAPTPTPSVPTTTVGIPSTGNLRTLGSNPTPSRTP